MKYTTTSIRFPKELYMQVRKKLIDDNLSFAAWVTRCMKQYIKED